jgi:hypothetical protein
LSRPNAKSGQVVLPATAKMVKQFYASYEISRLMLGIKDYVSINSEGKRNLEKQPILCNIRQS